MSCRIILVILIYCFSLTFSATAQTAPHKHALLIGVSDYARGKDIDAEWWNLNTTNDVKALRQVLIRKFSFKPTDITFLNTKAETTRQSILNAFKQLVAETKAGDIVYLHYSGHGGQVLDDNGDELDGLDETLIPSDYISKQDGSNDIRDDEIGKFLDALKAKNPASVILTFDSCFSGTITRGGRQLVRGAGYQGKIKPTPKITTRGTPTKDESGLLPKGSLGENYVLVSATRSDQVASETDDDKGGKMGALTYALIKVFSEAKPTTTYRDVFESLRQIVTSRVEKQNPQIEGSLDTVLLKGTAIPTQPYISLNLDKNNNIILQAGSLQGMTKGSKFAVFPNGAISANDSGKLADAEIVELDATTALIKLSASIKPEVLATARAFETEHKYSESLLKVSLPIKDNLPRQSEITAELAKFPLAEITTKDDWDVKIDLKANPPTTRGNEPQKLLLERSDGSKLAEIAYDENLARNVRVTLENEARFRTIRDLDNSSSEMKIEIRSVPVEVETNLRGNVEKILRDKELTASTSFSEGEYIQLEVRNTGNSDAFVTILDLTPDGKISPMFPSPRLQPDNKIKADGKWKRIGLPYVFRLTPPFGTEIFKAIATPEYTDFSPLFNAQLVIRGDDAGVKKATQTPLGKILRASVLRQRAENVGGTPPNWATSSVIFQVVPKK